MSTQTSTKPMPLERNELDELLFHALRAVYQFERQKVSIFGLTFEEIYLLQYLRRKSVCRVSDIAQEMKIPISTLSRLIGRLQHRGLVVRNQDPDDRRIMLVSLEAKGRQLVLNVEEHTYELINQNLSQFNPEDLASFIKTAEALKHILKPIEQTSAETIN